MLTVLMATHNGATTLPVVLNAYCKLVMPSGGWKIVIVDNGSTDRSKKIIESYGQRLPLTYVFEGRKGKNAALNTGLTHIEGDLVVFTDDDAVPRADWLVQLRMTADNRPAFAMFAGAIVPRWEVNPDPWILSCVPLHPTYGLSDLSWEEGPITPRRICGANSAYRTSIFKAGYSFDHTIGPSGPNYAMGSELELNVRLMKAGFTSWYCKRAIVEHIIRKPQMNKGWVLRRAFRSGRGDFRIEIKNELSSPNLFFGIPKYFLREITTQGLQVVKAAMKRDPYGVFVERWKLSFLFGRAYEARANYRTQPGDRVLCL
jgi:glycosyltransferase involved in cell wall biosynthesis